MKPRKSKYPQVDGLEITDIAAEGKSLGKYNDIVVFVPHTVPGDVVDVQINNKRRRFMEGYVVNFVKRSPIRVEPFCKHYGECGGCKWQALPYPMQLEYKQRQVEDQLRRLGKIELPEISPIIGSERSEYYRNKLEFTFSNKRWVPRSEVAAGAATGDGNALGFHIPGMFDKVLDVEWCHLQAEPSNAIRLAVKRLAEEQGLEFYNLRDHQGFLRNIIIRTATTGQVMVTVVFARDDAERRAALLDALIREFPQITSLNYIVNEKLNDSIGDQEVFCYAGMPYMEERMEHLTFRVNPKSFYQTNSEQAYNLYKVAREFAELTGSEVVYDLYTGTGTIANFVAARARKVVGIEYVPEAIEDAKQNSALNGIDNTLFFAGDMKDVLNAEFIERHGRPDVIILDPPRAGIHADVAATILAAAPERMVYVSCNPATQARDLAIFDAAYRVTRVQPVDMFPHTHHVENVVQLVRR
ncbi:23S rRNA (uracil(1939)-C(5))-methyltransferase RlmD [Millionella massiliensis]|uniref:23S rRNA (uracil(1939)-C(5))-methyltransferase RlmD n=1 Tax=Millionella massiliensis TaxID=1871023 RepID=UPI0024B75952|nr:23S rRNA (uracil(1939)-C(5))-methyltransferase RlmD [Millionella massiliensis]